MKVLVVEDDRDLRRLLTLALGTLGGMQVETLPGGEGIVQMVATGGFDVILLDVMMPGLDGLQCLDLLQANPRTQTVPVIFLTAKGDHEGRISLSERSGYGALSKPFDPLTLADTLRRLVDQEKDQSKA